MSSRCLSLSALVLLLACGDDSSVPDAGVDGSMSDGAMDGSTSDGSTSDASIDAGEAVDAGGDQPRIPEPTVECPSFGGESFELMGLTTTIAAGVPTADKGPILFVWHGTGGSGSRSLSGLPSSMVDDIVAQGGLIVAPSDNGLAREGFSPNGVWYEGSDLEYADEIVACAARDHNIDPRRIYVTGCSAGGLMASAMAIRRSSYVAAVAPNSGGLLGATALEDPAHVPAVMTMHGGAGDTVIVNFQDTSERLLDFVQEAGGFAADCNHMNGHCGVPADLALSAWAFLDAHRFGTSSPFASGLPSDYPSYCRLW